MLRRCRLVGRILGIGITALGYVLSLIHILRQLGQLPVNTWKEYIRNDFEATVFQKYPSLTLLKQQLYERGAEFVSMSGSGSAIYGLFKKDREINLDFPDCCVWQGETLI